VADELPVALPLDYDANPDRFRTGRAVARAYSTVGDVHERVAARLRAERYTPVLDLGCGSGELARLLDGSGLACIGLDLSAVLLADAPRPAIRGDAAQLPFAKDSFSAVAALYMLYHLAEPEVVLREARRVLRPGGLFVAAAPSRHDAPELRELDLEPPAAASTFDAEIAPELIGRVFAAVEVQTWDGPFIHLPDAEAVRRYLVGRGLDARLAAERTRGMRMPLNVTKRGALVYAKDA
jgi:SAM-dependent methyltransferase